MKLNLLRYAYAVADTASFTLAAERCFVTQPTLSNGINQLEQELEHKLFTRTTRSVTLTPFGAHILPKIKAVLDANNDLIREARDYRIEANATIRIGTSPLINGDWLSSLLLDFKNHVSDVEIILHERNMSDLFNMLEDGLLDFVFGVSEIRKDVWQTAPLYQDPLFFVPRGNSLLGDRQSVKLQDIAGETFVMVPNACGLAKATRALFSFHHVELNEYSGEALSYQVLEQWASLGLGAAILPKSKLLKPDHLAHPLVNDQGADLFLQFEAVWRSKPIEANVGANRFADYLLNGMSIGLHEAPLI